MRIIVVIAVLGLLSATSAAAEDNANSRRLLESDEPNFFGVSGSAGNPDLGEDTHFEFYISIRYPLIEDWFEEKRLMGLDVYPDTLYGIYNGGYDFYAWPFIDSDSYDTWYDSAPVISKHQNPGIAAEWDIGDGRRKFRIGLFHYSNGQAIDEDDRTTIDSYENDPLVEPYYWLEQVSRSSNYLQLRYQHMENKDEDIRPGFWQYQVELRPEYVSTDDNIWWDDTIIEQPKFEDYDGVRLYGEYVLPSNIIGNMAWIFRGQVKTGISEPDALGNVSGKLTLGVMYKTFIVSAYYSNGYGHDLSTYHLRTRHWGIGLELR